MSLTVISLRSADPAEAVRAVEAHLFNMSGLPPRVALSILIGAAVGRLAHEDARLADEVLVNARVALRRHLP